MAHTMREVASGAIPLLGLVKERSGDYTSATQLPSSQFELVISQPDRRVSLFPSVVRSGQSDKIPKIVDVLKLHATDKLWADAIGRCIQLAAMGDLQTAEARQPGPAQLHWDRAVQALVLDTAFPAVLKTQPM